MGLNYCLTKHLLIEFSPEGIRPARMSSEKMEEWNGLIDALEVRGDIFPAAYFAPLFPGEDVFFIDLCIENLDECLLSSMVFRY